MSRFDTTGTLNRLLDQYRESPRLAALLQALLDAPKARVRAALESLYGRLDIDTAQGWQLDLIGTIVGQTRPDSFELALTDVATPFEFYDGSTNDFSKGFSGLDGPRNGGQFVGIEAAQGMRDEDYRLILKAAIYRNNNGASIPNLETYTALILGEPATVADGDGYVDVLFPRRLGPVERELILQTLTPAAGVRIGTLTFVTAADGFGFAGAAGNTGFGGIGVARVGSGFAGVF